MFAGGLSMFGSGGEDDDDEEESANAGIELALLGSQLRPFVFFQGQSELMNHIFSGTASSRTTALQGTVLLQDHSQIIPLQNGLSAELILTGSVSYDFAGKVEVSLWYQNANSWVEIGASGVIQGQARVDNSFIQTMVEFNAGSQTQLDFLSNLESSPSIMMCLRMVQPDLEIIENVRKFERIPGSNYVLRKYKRKSSTVTGKTYVMNKKNTEICNQINKTIIILNFNCAIFHALRRV
ncbi:Microsomal triglyceride transfer protein large subunit [Armadillidium nasatum]|uniref:Microsomal triglyceride transfer protein large subunit n=1 Tax=Armadillidium nasatum TaxID=96803 RepID=A0A5N5SVS8_9CRUS|nr:Microsomal triglyceride transfer protein large subunit [Armadillidium nasatum]